MKSLLLFGDSWGRGEFDYSLTDREPIAHPGLEHYLSEDFTVKNFSREGNSLWQIAYSLQNYLQQYRDLQQTPTILVLQTDATRIGQARVYDVDYLEVYRTSDDLISIYQRLLEIWYIKLNDIAERFDVMIHVSAGLTDLDTSLLLGLPRLKIACASWIQLLEPRHKINVMPLLVSPQFMQDLYSVKRHDLVEDLLKYIDDVFLSAQALLEGPYMGPTPGDFHPNRVAHQILSEHIQPLLKNDQA